MSVTHLPRLLTIREAVQALHEAAGGERPPVCAQTLRREIRRGHLKVRKIGGAFRIWDEELARWARGDQ